MQTGPMRERGSQVEEIAQHMSELREQVNNSRHRIELLAHAVFGRGMGDSKMVNPEGPPTQGLLNGLDSNLASILDELNTMGDAISYMEREASMDKQVRVNDAPFELRQPHGGGVMQQGLR